MKFFNFNIYIHLINLFAKVLSIINYILNLTILILNMLFLNYFHILPNPLNAKKISLFFGATTCENIKYVVIIFQNVSKKRF